jgi:hypothetical protein
MDTLLKQKQTESAWVHVVQNHISSMRFGVVQIVVHDSRVVQIERTEKFRLDRPGEKASSAIHLADLQNPDGAQPQR